MFVSLGGHILLFAITYISNLNHLPDKKYVTGTPLFPQHRLFNFLDPVYLVVLRKLSCIEILKMLYIKLIF